MYVCVGKSRPTELCLEWLVHLIEWAKRIAYNFWFWNVAFCESPRCSVQDSFFNLPLVVHTAAAAAAAAAACGHAAACFFR